MPNYRITFESKPVQHIKRGSTYQHLTDEVTVQCDLKEGDKVALYVCEADQSLHVRKVSEFWDGRFKLLPTPVFNDDSFDN